MVEKERIAEGRRLQFEWRAVPNHMESQYIISPWCTLGDVALMISQTSATPESYQ